MSKMRAAVFSFVLILCSALLCSCTNENLVVMRIDGQDIYAYEYAYYLNSYKNIYEQNYGTEIWEAKDGDTGMADYVKKLAADQTIFRQQIIKAAKNQGITLTSEDMATLKNNKKEEIETAGGIAEWQSNLSKVGMSDRLYDSIAQSSLLYEKLNEKLYGQNGTERLTDEQFLEYYKSNYISAAHILKKTTDDDNNALSDKEIEQKREQAMQLLVRARSSGEDFNALAADNSDDTGIVSNPNGYTFKQGQMVDEFYNGAIALSENQISDIVESSYGFHIIKRLPLDMEYYNENKEQLENEYYESELNKYLDEQKDSLEIEYTDSYEKINVNQVEAFI